MKCNQVCPYNTLKGYNDEEKRICYVAATRAKETLIWMTNKPQKKKYPQKQSFLSFKEF